MMRCLPWLLLCSAPALADNMRCGNHLVYDGDDMALVAKRCGEPAQISRSSVLKFPTLWYGGTRYQLSNQRVEVPVETWVYNFGPRQFMRELRFEDGILVEIRTLDYGYVPQ